MALGIKDQPQVLAPTGIVMPLVIDSSQAALNNFRYEVKIQEFTGSAWSDIVTNYLYPDLDNNGYGIYDNSIIIKNYVSSNPQIIFSEDLIDSDSVKWFRNYVTEYLGSTAGDTYSTNLKNAFQGVVQYGTTWDYTDYLLSTITPAKFLSIKSTRKYSLDTWSVINMFSKVLGNPLHLKITVFTDRSTTYEYEFPAAYYDNYIYAVPIGPENLNAMARSGKLTLLGVPTTDDIIGSDAQSYNISILDVFDAIVTEVITVTLNHNCYIEDGVDFIYLGELGTYETFTANYADVKGFKTSKSEIQSDYYSINEYDKYTYTVGDRGRKIVNRRTVESHSVYTGWLNDAETINLMELLNSTDVYIRSGTNVIPIIITNTKYIENNRKQERLKNYSINYDNAIEKLSN